jgi:hypothetical protein
MSETQYDLLFPKQMMLRSFATKAAKLLRLGNKNKFDLFCITLDFSYLCRRYGKKADIIDQRPCRLW